MSPPRPAPPPLLFVYNADGGVLNSLKDLWHKTVSPQTYDCQLCAVTYGPLGMRREWREFVRGLGTEVKFLHRDELQEQYGLSGVSLPAVFEQTPEGPRVWLSAQDVRGARDLEALMELVERRRAGTP